MPRDVAPSGHHRVTLARHVARKKPVATTYAGLLHEPQHGQTVKFAWWVRGHRWGCGEPELSPAVKQSAANAKPRLVTAKEGVWLSRTATVRLHQKPGFKPFTASRNQ